MNYNHLINQAMLLVYEQHIRNTPNNQALPKPPVLVGSWADADNFMDSYKFDDTLYGVRRVRAFVMAYCKEALQRWSDEAVTYEGPERGSLWRSLRTTVLPELVLPENPHDFYDSMVGMSIEGAIAAVNMGGYAYSGNGIIYAPDPEKEPGEFRVIRDDGIFRYVFDESREYRTSVQVPIQLLRDGSGFSLESLWSAAYLEPNFEGDTAPPVSRRALQGAAMVFATLKPQWHKLCIKVSRVADLVIMEADTFDINVGPSLLQLWFNDDLLFETERVDTSVVDRLHAYMRNEGIM